MQVHNFVNWTEVFYVLNESVEAVVFPDNSILRIRYNNFVMSLLNNSDIYVPLFQHLCRSNLTADQSQSNQQQHHLDLEEG